jgi:hypothetical protein
MRKCLSTLTVVLIVGAVFNVAIAWSCMLIWAPVAGGENERWMTDEETISVVRSSFKTVRPLNPDECVGSVRWRTGWSRNMVTCCPDASDPGEFLEVWVLSAGWPAHCMVGKSLWESGITRYEHALMLPDALCPVGPRRLNEFLPLRPIWPAFGLNMLLYAACIWGVSWGPLAVRRTIRQKRGACPSCGYKLFGESSHGCPECGWKRKKEKEIDTASTP